MKYLIYLVIFSLTTLSSGAGLAADTLSNQQIEQFISSMPEVNAMGDQMKQEGKSEIINAKIHPQPGEEFAVYTKAVNKLKSELPSDYKKLGAITGKHGFSSQEKWAKTGDMVTRAYMATKMDGVMEKMKQTQAQIPPEVLAQMPPEAKVKMQQSMQMAEAFTNVPPEHVAAVTPYIPQLEKAMEQ